MACRIEWQPDPLFVISTSAYGREFAFPKAVADFHPTQAANGDQRGGLLGSHGAVHVDGHLRPRAWQRLRPGSRPSLAKHWRAAGSSVQAMWRQCGSRFECGLSPTAGSPVLTLAAAEQAPRSTKPCRSSTADSIPRGISPRARGHSMWGGNHRARRGVAARPRQRREDADWRDHDARADHAGR